MQIDRDTIVKLARESYIFPTQEKDDNGTGMWFTFTVYKGSIDALEKFAKLVAEHEREACAKVCDARAVEYDGFSAEQNASEKLAAAIRERGK